MNRYIFIALSLFLSCKLAIAEEPQITGNQIAPACKLYLSSPNQLSICPVFLRGVFEGHLQAAVAYGIFNNIQLFNELPFVWCPSDRSAVSDSQLVNIFSKYLELHPEATDRGATSLATVAFMKSWPCKK
jgi:hypothetical protein